MKIKLRYSNILYYFIIIIIICECNGFRLFKLDDNIYKAIYLVIIMMILLICILHAHILDVCTVCGKFIIVYNVMTVLFLLFQYVYMKHLYGTMQTTYEFANYCKNYAFIFISIPLFYIFFKRDSYREVMDSVMFLITITLGLMLLNAVFYKWDEVELLNISVYEKKLIRNNRIRIWDLSSLEGLAIIYGTYVFIYEKRKKILYFIETVICISALVYVEQTRMMLIALTISILLLIILKPCRKTEGILAKGILVSLSCLAGSVFVIPKLIVSLNQGISISNRLIELQFVFQVLSNKGIFGLGLINHRLQSRLFYHGVYSRVSLNDIGLIGYTAQVGIWSVVLFIVPMLRMAWIIWKGRKNEFQFLLWAVYIYLVITSLTLFILDSQRILMWPFCLALFEFYYKKCLEKQDVSGT